MPLREVISSSSPLPHRCPLYLSVYTAAIFRLISAALSQRRAQFNHFVRTMQRYDVLSKSPASLGGQFGENVEAVAKHAVPLDNIVSGKYASILDGE